MNKYYFSLFGLLFLLPSCGKHEADGGAVGAASGAVVGRAVSGKRSKGTGTLVGALVGNIIGRQAGKALDEEEKKELIHVRSFLTYKNFILILKEICNHTN